MLISINWIKEFTDLTGISVDELSQRYTMATCEIETVTEVGGLLSKISVAEIAAIEPHPNSDKLNLVTISTGAGSETVVCGAPNVEVGMKVPYAPLGTTFPNGLTLVPKEIRGVLSKGMLCSEDELGLGNDSSGLMRISSDVETGKPLSEIYSETSDTIIEVDNKSITHRPDLWGHFGQAREFALVFDKELNSPFSDSWRENILQRCSDEPSPIVPQVDESACKAFYGLSIDGVRVNESPKWMQDKLNLCGIKPINSIVDISNYVMLELGIPLHIYDRELIKDGVIRVHRLDEDSRVVTLDGVERQMKAGETVVSDSSGPLVIAGIMGGESSGVNDSTSKIFVEVANWIDSEVRKTSTRLGLRTDSSQRYEKSLDSQLLERTMIRTVELILQLNPEAQIVGSIEKGGPETAGYTPLRIQVGSQQICKVLGKEVEQDRIVKILQGLDFKVAVCGDMLNIEVPSFRATKDVDCSADIIEEIGRIIGYDSITPEPTYDRTSPVRLSSAKQLQRKISDFLVLNCRMVETMTYPMIGEDLLKKAEWHTLNSELVLVNALSHESDRMRPSMIPSFLEMASKNCKNYDSFATFEIGRTYLPDAKSFSKEATTLTIALYDRGENPFMKLVNHAERLLKYLNLPAQLTAHSDKHPNLAVPNSWKGLHPHEILDIKMMGRNFGVITTIHPILARSFKIKGNLAILTLDLSSAETLKPKEKVAYQALSKFPSSSFDCTVLLSDDQEVSETIATVTKLKLEHVQSITISSVFKISDDSRAVTVRTVFLNTQATLTQEFLENAKNSIVESLEKSGFPLKR